MVVETLTRLSFVLARSQNQRGVAAQLVTHLDAECGAVLSGVVSYLRQHCPPCKNYIKECKDAPPRLEALKEALDQTVHYLYNMLNYP